MRILKKLLQILTVNTLLVVWCAGILSLDCVWYGGSYPDPGAILAVVISIALAWHYIMETGQ